MCGRYNLGPPVAEEELREILRSAQTNTKNQELLQKMKASGEIFPTNIVPVIAPDGAQAMHWGMPLIGGKYRVINSRSDKLWGNREYKHLLTTNQRCLVPIVYYYEWLKKDEKTKVRYNFRMEDEPVMYIAGIYKVKDVETPSFSIITTEASKHVAWIHDRMPLILPPDARKEWLAPGGAVDDVLNEAIKSVIYQEDDNKPLQMDMFGEE